MAQLETIAWLMVKPLNHAQPLSIRPSFPIATPTLLLPHVVNALPDGVLLLLLLLLVNSALLLRMLVSTSLFLAIMMAPLTRLSARTALLVIVSYQSRTALPQLLTMALRSALSVLLDSTSARSVLASQVPPLLDRSYPSVIGLALAQP